MLFLKRILARWAFEGADSIKESGNQKYPEPTSVRNGLGRGTVKSSNSHSEQFKNPLNITLFNAVGGKIIKFYAYDQENDRSTETTYIITNEENFEEALGKFIAMEALKFNG